LTKEDIRWVLSNYLTDGTVEKGDETMRIVVGFDRAATNLLFLYHRHKSFQIILKSIFSS